uniref:Uncharacterized protein n=1 Tax=Manihot esculenta TaxID=3983 RepID=A0A2C9W8T0_MANES
MVLHCFCLSLFGSVAYAVSVASLFPSSIPLGELPYFHSQIFMSHKS